MLLDPIPVPAELDVTVFHGIVTQSPQMLEFFELLRRAARSGASILIRGESGTGKELAAAAIHRLSRRRERPFKAINCATLTPELAASELFGHVRGAFTGAIRERAGLFALADGGTVFLDEVAELSPDIQARLLRVLQERTFVPIGGTEPVQVDVRLLAATNKSLRDEVEQRRFREDLMYRIRVVPLFLPPLVEREGDIETLIWHFIRQFNARADQRQRGNHEDDDVPWRQIEALAPDAHARLLAYHWPGNVRELRNVIEYVFAIGEGEVLEGQELPPELRGEPPPRTTRIHPYTISPADDERARILEALRIAKGLKSRAAELLGISRTTLWRKMRELELGG
ncbi:Two component, sigma54 specific, transcriptional regulator, Fis family protein [Enhygromyxa salina]|uniref:Two component, sigma54 specific, transcriptional regulator, Fis family protein n=1 Tax=Enhygromyxa salina TaxID=215803 RepID=A0A0C2A4Y1_9BACT|nr:sigma 54-interacting transcriptional regulator [Enhygromyxa salina]KIG18468.1 Two component, sigma54 specific, transcriptional regulator, Fis family protein [Enhygromyxa salina]